MLANDGEPHSRLRQAISPGFRPDQLRQYHDIMVAVTAEAIDGYQSGTFVDLAAEVRRITLSIAGRTLFGLNLIAETTLFNAFSYLTQKATKPLTAWDNLPVVLPISPYRRYTKALHILEETVSNAIRQAQADNERHDQCFLAQLVHPPISSAPRLSEEETRDQVLQLLDAGHSTTSGTLAWCFYLIAENPSVRAKLCAELAEVVPAGIPTFDDLSRLTYTDQVIREVLRLYPPIWAQARYVNKEFEFNNYTIPAGSYVLLSQWVTHRLPELFPDPERFNPARFAPNVQHVPYSYFPFGGGRHACLGATYAIHEAKVVLAMILARFNPLLRRQHHVKPVVRSMTLQPRFGIPVMLEAASGVNRELHKHAQPSAED